jgi:monovalent cation:proton antiporter-2 (CPA2) family protein
MAGATEIPAFLSQPVVLLSAAVVAVPLFKRFKLSAVLGYLAAGVAVGPDGLGFFPSGEDMMHVAELGVVLLLFVIGLELKPSRLWTMRHDIFGLGSAQILTAGLGILAVALWAGHGFGLALVAAMGLALSSTALVMQILDERAEMQTEHGRKVFSVLLMQDLAIVPMLGIVALFSAGTEASTAELAGTGLAMVAAVVAVILAGRYLLNPFFALLASTGAREIMTAAALLVVVGAATVMVSVGLSMAMGAFLAGVLLAESNFRHQLEADIEPFRGILLGLFFMAVGMMVALDVVFANFGTLLLATLLLLTIKTATLYSVLRLTRVGHAVSLRSALFLAQGGEFGFVLFSAALAGGLMSAEMTSFLIALVTLSMALTPFLVMLADRFARDAGPGTMEEDYSDAQGSILMIGFGRFGQVVSQSLLAAGIEVTLIEKNVGRIRDANQFGFKVYFGDGTRLDVLRAAGAARARLICICVDHERDADMITEMVRAEFPYAMLGVRAYDRGHALKLEALNTDFEIRETFESALAFGRKSLESMGIEHDMVVAILADVRARDADRFEMQRAGGINAGSHRLRVRPEPLVPPRSESEALSPATETVSSKDNDFEADSR